MLNEIMHIERIKACPGLRVKTSLGRGGWRGGWGGGTLSIKQVEKPQIKPEAQEAGNVSPSRTLVPCTLNIYVSLAQNFKRF